MCDSTEADTKQQLSNQLYLFWIKQAFAAVSRLLKSSTRV